MEIIYKHFETLSSTNDEAKGELKKMEPDTLLIVVAGTQTAGRGQYGRSWVSPKCVNLYVSFAYFAKQRQDPVALTHVLALSTASALLDFGVESRIKKPNDLLVAGKKIAGILCETQDEQHGMVVGLGLNVNMDAASLNELGRPATSILQETGVRYPLEDVQRLITNYFIADLTLFLESGFVTFEERFERLLITG